MSLIGKKKTFRFFSMPLSMPLFMEKDRKVLWKLLPPFFFPLEYHKAYGPIRLQFPLYHFWISYCLPSASSIKQYKDDFTLSWAHFLRFILLIKFKSFKNTKCLLKIYVNPPPRPRKYVFTWSVSHLDLYLPEKLSLLKSRIAQKDLWRDIGK